MTIDFDVLVCPFCFQGKFSSMKNKRITCDSCGRVCLIKNGIPILLQDGGLDTLLDLEEYIAVHPTDEKIATENYRKNWEYLFDEYCNDFSSVLELGSGTGHLTFGLANFSKFERILCTDVSLKFLNHLLSWIDNDKVHPYVVDANNMPFLANSMSAVVGHSVLHHFLYYKKVLSDIHGLLKSGGVAIFGEPILDAFAMMSFIASMILATNERIGLVEFTTKEVEVLNWMKRLEISVNFMRNDPESLASMEDKYLFGIQEMIRVGRNIGFKEVVYINPRFPVNYKQYIMSYITNRFMCHSGTNGHMDQFGFIVDNFVDTYVNCMGAEYPRFFGFFVFVK